MRRESLLKALRTISDVLKDSAKWLTVNVSSGGKFASVEYTRRRVLVFIRKKSSALGGAPLTREETVFELT
jgi:hypothetical protein